MLFSLPIVLIVTIVIQCTIRNDGVVLAGSEYKIGHFQIVNYNDEPILIKEVAHLIRNDRSNKHSTSLGEFAIPGRKVSTTFQFHYQNGWLWQAGFDYWYIKVTYDGKTWYTKDNFWCNIAPEDSNGTVTLVVKMNPGELEVKPPKSSSCFAWLWNWQLRRRN